MSLKTPHSKGPGLRAVAMFAAGVAVLLPALLPVLTAQTKVTTPKNKYSRADDVKLGREAADEVRKEMPMLKDDPLVSSYVSDLGKRLVAAAPKEYQFPEFTYTFETVNVSDLNAFALPGGPMFVHRGIIEASKVEGELVGVMAHEISHVLLRHGTANMTKASNPWIQLGQAAAAVGGAVVGGSAGSLIAQGGQIGVGSILLKNSRDFEKQADILGAQIMARASYDARDMASLFRTLEKEGSSGPQFLSDHPNPGNRAQYITKEAEAIPVANPIHASAAFDKVTAHLKTLPKVPTSSEVAKAAKAAKDAAAAPGGAAGSAPAGSAGGAAPTGRVPAPSTSFRAYNEGNVFEIAVPSNWQELPGGSSVTFSPPGGYGAMNGQSVFTHGVEASVSRASGRGLQPDTDALLADLRNGNPKMGRPAAYRNATIGGRRGLQTVVDNVSDATGQAETILILTTTLANGDLLSVIFVSPTNQYPSYQPVFQKVASSIRFAQ